MNGERELISKVVSFLKENGYPAESILLEHAMPGVDGRFPFRADITIVDPIELRPMAIFEIKAKTFSKPLYAQAVNQIHAHVSCLRSPLRIFLVLSSNNKRGFVIYDVTTNERGNNVVGVDEAQNGDLPHVVSFDDLVRGNLVDRRSSAIENKGRRHDEFEKRRWVGCVFLMVLFVRDYGRNGWGLSWECLAVLCGAFALWLSPYFDVIGFKDIVLQRHKEMSDSKL